MTAHTGGRSLAYVPRLRLLLARRRGGSSRSPCHAPFSPRILEHLIGFYFLIRQRSLWLLSFGIGLQLVAHGRGRRPADGQLSRQFRRRFTLANTLDEQNRLLWPEISPFKDGTAAVPLPGLNGSQIPRSGRAGAVSGPASNSRN